LSELEISEYNKTISRLEEKIRELQELNLKLVNANSELRALGSIKDEFINIASHELRGPVQPILGYITMAKNGMVSPDAALDVIYNEAIKLKQAAHNILDSTKLDNQAMSYNFEKVNLHEVLVRSMTAIGGTIDRSKVVLIPQMDKNHENIEISVDKSRIEQVFTNILGNAVKFTKQGSITATTKVSKEANMIEILISDTGTGIPEEMLQKLFEKYAAINKNNSTGMGLGLFICKSIVVAHGGTIEAKNNEKGGATIRITLPLKRN